jgi:hypothetical protein
LTVVFQDGEPVDPKKLQDLQTQIDAIQLKTDESYNLSTSTANSVTQLAVMHLKAGVVTFENGLTGGKVNSIEIELGWGADYEVAYVVATPRLQDPKTNSIRWSLSGNSANTKLNVFAEKNISNAVNFHWISAGKKIVSGS